MGEIFIKPRLYFLCGVDRMTTSKPPSYRWVILFAYVFAFMTSFAYAFAIVQPSVPTFMKEFELDLPTVLLIVTAMSVAAAVMSIPSGILTDAWGIKRTTILSMVLLLIGWIICYIAPDFNVLLVGRSFIGLGGVTLSVVAPPAIISWFPPKEIGLAMGIWSIGMPLGLSWQIPFSTWVMETYGWRTAYVFGAVFSLLFLVALSFVAKPGPALPQAPPTEKRKISMADAFKSVEIWKFSIAVMLFIITFMTIQSAYQTWLIEVKGLDSLTAGSITGLIGLMGIIAAPISGWISDKIGGRKKPMFALSAILSGIAILLFAYIGPELVVPITILIGFFLFMNPPHMFGIPPLLVRPELGGTALGIVITFFYIAGIFGPMWIGSVYATQGINMACIVQFILCVISALIALTVKTK